MGIGDLGSGLFLGGVADSQEKRLERERKEKRDAVTLGLNKDILSFNKSKFAKNFAQKQQKIGAQKVKDGVEFYLNAKKENATDAELKPVEDSVVTMAEQVGGPEFAKKIRKRIQVFGGATTAKPAKGPNILEQIKRKFAAGDKMEPGEQKLLDNLILRKKNSDLMSAIFQSITGGGGAAGQQNGGDAAANVTPSPSLPAPDASIAPTGGALPIQSFPSLPASPAAAGLLPPSSVDAPVPIPTQAPATPAALLSPPSAPTGLPLAPVAPTGAEALASPFLPPPGARRATNPTTGEVIFVLPDGSILDANGALIQGGAQGTPIVPIRGLGQ